GNNTTARPNFNFMLSALSLPINDVKNFVNFNRHEDRIALFHSHDFSNLSSNGARRRDYAALDVIVLRKLYQTLHYLLNRHPEPVRPQKPYLRRTIDDLRDDLNYEMSDS